MYRGDPEVNSNGGVYLRGRRYNLLKKQSVAIEYFKLQREVGQERVNISEVARRGQVGWGYAKMVVEEYCGGHSGLRDPSEKYERKILARKNERHLSIEEEVYLLALQAEDPTRTNLEYINLPSKRYGCIISSSFLSKWFKTRFEFPGNFKKPNVVPLDKW